MPFLVMVACSQVLALLRIGVLAGLAVRWYQHSVVVVVLPAGTASVEKKCVPSGDRAKLLIVFVSIYSI